MVFGERGERHRVIETAGHLKRGGGMGVDVVEVVGEVPADEAGAEKVSGARELAGRGSYTDFCAAEEGVFAQAVLKVNQGGAHTAGTSSLPLLLPRWISRPMWS